MLILFVHTPNIHLNLLEKLFFRIRKKTDVEKNIKMFYFITLPFKNNYNKQSIKIYQNILRKNCYKIENKTVRFHF